MTTFKATLSSHRKKDGTARLSIRVTHRRVSRYLPTDTYLAPDQYTRTGRIKDQRIIDSSDAMIRELRQKVDALGWQAQDMTCDEVCDAIRRREEIVLPFWEHVAAAAATKSKSTSLSYAAAAKAFREFAGDMDAATITRHDVQRWVTMMEMRGLRPSVIKLYLSRLRAVHEKLRFQYNDEERGIVRIPWQPFSKVQLPKMNEASHVRLTREQVQKLIDFVPADRNAAFARKVWLLSFGLMGMNYADLWHYDGSFDVIRYRRRKIAGMVGSGADMEVRVEPCVRGLVEALRVGDRFWFSERWRRYDAAIAQLGKSFLSLTEELGFKVTFYSARHSWASMARNEAGVDKWTVDECLCHQHNDLKMADIYIQRDFRHLWEANARTLALFSWPEEW